MYFCFVSIHQNEILNMHKICILLIAFIVSTGFVKAYEEFIDPNPGNGNRFGDNVVVLTNGNVVISSPAADINGVENCGAVYLYNGRTGELISTLFGTSVNDYIGLEGITGLPNGNYIVTSCNWDNDNVTNVGAVTWVNGITGINGSVSITNSLVGSSKGDFVGNSGITVLPNGNYLVASHYWQNGTATHAGAVTWGNGNTGVSGIVSKNNSLIGSSIGDILGFLPIKVLLNSNYVVCSYQWSNSRGAVTWGNGEVGICGEIDSTISLVGSTENDNIGSQFTMLKNGNYIVYSRFWKNGNIINAGAVTWGSSNKPLTGVVSKYNSLVGTHDSDEVGTYSVIPLNNGNYVVQSCKWDNGDIRNCGAVTFANGETGILGEVNEYNSIIGSSTEDEIGSIFIELENGNYVLGSPLWSNGNKNKVGAVTWLDSNKPLIGRVDTTNSLFGSRELDRIGCFGIVDLENGNYVVVSSNWHNKTIRNAGAVTFGNGKNGVFGEINETNSLIGSKENDFVGIDGVTVLKNSNYIVSSSRWHNGWMYDVGAVTWGDGEKGVTGIVSIENSIYGSTPDDKVGDECITALQNGNYLISSPFWDNGSIVNAGAVTWCNGFKKSSGIVNDSNSLVGVSKDDYVGNYCTNIELSNGNYLVYNNLFDKDTCKNVGAITWGNGTYGIFGKVSVNNSLIGSATNDGLGAYLYELQNNKYLMLSPDFDYNGLVDVGAVTIFDGDKGICGEITDKNSLVGTKAGDGIGLNVTVLPNGNYLIRSEDFDSKRGAVTLGIPNKGLSGSITSENSIIGHTTNANLQAVVTNDIAKEFYVIFVPDSATGKVYRCNYNGIDSVSNVYDNDILLTCTTPFPNPVSNSINLRIDIKNNCLVNVKLYNVTGDFFCELYNKFVYAGYNESNFDLSNIPSGSYQLVVTQGDKVDSYSITVVK